MCDAGPPCRVAATSRRWKNLNCWPPTSSSSFVRCDSEATATGVPTSEIPKDRILSAMSRCRHAISIAVAILALAGESRANVARHPPRARKDRAKVLVLGVYHFQSRNNLKSQRPDDITTPSRQAQIAEVVRRVAAFKPTKVALEQPTGTSDIERQYEGYLAGNFTLGVAETYQIGFRVARL